ncbi:hypothetical protein bthur0009_8960 [Bacillus thuringiensis serovar andalousiensis BGSC 4AW1]|nr:hypothetical protein bthur0009_8960 [Bacillus thuringiensis serovar andalousiensis BGSC 4AW1]
MVFLSLPLQILLSFKKSILDPSQIIQKVPLYVYNFTRSYHYSQSYLYN